MKNNIEFGLFGKNNVTTVKKFGTNQIISTI